LQEVMERSGQNLNACYQCRRCAAGCPVGDVTGVTPDRLIRMIVLGDREGAMNNLLVWQCVACYTCGTRCPNSIHTARITEALKQMVKEAHMKPLTPKVANFHSSFLTSASHFGRLNELEFMGMYEIKNAKDELRGGGGLKAVIEELKTQARLGKQMMKLKRMHFGMDKVKGMSEVKRLYNKSTGK
ncbi:MAG: 4Fe-4S dicluster domain-containing protein, partial [Nitrospirae bacterium]|nr:4Fe-4S dicluster domain-containing protein [Nitrospirota bacterium]